MEPVLEQDFDGLQRELGTRLPLWTGDIYLSQHT